LQCVRAYPIHLLWCIDRQLLLTARLPWRPSAHLQMAIAKPSIGQPGATFAFSCRFESLESFAMEVSLPIIPVSPTHGPRTHVHTAVKCNGGDIVYREALSLRTMGIVRC